MMRERKPILEVKDLRVSFRLRGKKLRAVDGVSFSLYPKEILCLVGESGCGKSVTALSILQLISRPPGSYDSGSVIFHEKNLLSLSESALRGIRGNEISMIFQEPMTSLNPVLTIGYQLTEGIRIHHQCTKNEGRDRAIEMMNLVGIPSAKERFDQYPHQMSGGMRQRIMIAMALACEPKVLIADEPTTALDVTIQAQILDLIQALQEKMGMSVLLITHDLGVVAQVAHEVAVMYAGVIVEKASVNDLFSNPQHPYTIALEKSLPKPGTHTLETIPGSVPSIADIPNYCRFYERCSIAEDACKQTHPSLIETTPGHWVRCQKV